MGKTLSELREECRTRLAEPSPDFFSDAELDRWLNRAQSVFCEATAAFRSMWALDLVENQAEYARPNDIITIEHVWYRQDESHDYVPLNYRLWSSFSEWPTPSNSAGVAVSISLRRDNILVLDAVPTADCTSGLLLEGTQEPLELVEETDEIFRPKNTTDPSSPYIQRYWDELIYFVMWKASEKDRNFDVAQYAQAQWMRGISQARSALNNQIEPRRVRKTFGSTKGQKWPRIDDGGVTP